VSTPEAPSTLFETTNGLACANSFIVALDRAVREVVERDALMLAWLTHCGGKRVFPDRYLSPRQCEQISRLSDMGIQFRLRNISTEFGISVFLTVIFASFPGNRVGIAFGAGAHRLPEFAARHAFREAGLSWRGVAWRSIAGERPEQEDMTPKSFAEHTEYYSSWKRMHLLDFLLADDTIEDTEDATLTGANTADYDGGHIKLLLQRGRRILATDITPEQAAGAGLVIVQAIVPGLVPLYIADRCADELALKRLPTKIGGCTQNRPDSLNTGIHPWP
jgi:thiazole/oxazole-forming peptide maturase SagD family component